MQVEWYHKLFIRWTPGLEFTPNIRVTQERCQDFPPLLRRNIIKQIAFFQPPEQLAAENLPPLQFFLPFYKWGIWGLRNHSDLLDLKRFVHLRPGFESSLSLQSTLAYILVIKWTSCYPLLPGERIPVCLQKRWSVAPILPIFCDAMW